jgi:hypothetical protein
MNVTVGDGPFYGALRAENFGACERKVFGKPNFV